MTPTRDEYLLHLNTEIEKRERRLAGYEKQPHLGERHWPSYNRTIEEKKRLEAERARFLAGRPAPPSTRKQAAESESTHHRAMVDAYIEEVFRKTKKKITRKSIWTEAGYKSRTEFERWERQDAKHPNMAADKNFTRILNEKPHLK